MSAAINGNLIPTKEFRQVETYEAEGYIPTAQYYVFNNKDLQPNILYDFTPEDYAFLDKQTPPIDEDLFEHIMVVLDLMFPYRYKNITVSVDGYAFKQISDGVVEVLSHPKAYGMCWDPDPSVELSVIKTIYPHFCAQRNKTRQPIL